MFDFKTISAIYEKVSLQIVTALKTWPLTAPLLALFMDLNNTQTEDKLKNRYLHAEYKSEASVQSSNDEITKYQNFTLDCTLEEMSVHKEVKYSQSIPRPSVFPESALYPVIPVDA